MVNNFIEKSINGLLSKKSNMFFLRWTTMNFTNKTYFWTQHLTVFDAHGEKWKQLRKALSPTFTSGKLKGMFDNLDIVAENMIKCLQEKNEKVIFGDKDKLGHNGI